MIVNASNLFEILKQHNKPFVCFLQGDLGAGKTTFVRQYMQHLGYQGLVKSPSYTLVELYESEKIAHLDLYRINFVDKNLLQELALTEYLGDFSIFIEWPERLAPGLIEPDFKITITIDPETNDRLFNFQP